MIEEWKSALDNGNMVGRIEIDLRRAFDSLSHVLLLAKIQAYGVNIESCKLIASYLHNRHHRVKIRDKRIDWLQIKRGVPQGSVMGPLPFNIFINDIFFSTMTLTFITMQMTTAYHLKVVLLISSQIRCIKKVFL